MAIRCSCLMRGQWSQQLGVAGVGIILALSITSSALRDSAERDTVTLTVNNRGKTWKLDNLSSGNATEISISRESATDQTAQKTYYLEAHDLPEDGAKEKLPDWQVGKKTGAVGQKGLAGRKKGARKKIAARNKPVKRRTSLRWKDTLRKLRLKRKGKDRRDFWMYNPFRKYFAVSMMTWDVDCPAMDDFDTSKIQNWTLGEVMMCELRYATLHVCKLPDTTCTTCRCPLDVEGTPYTCVPDKCYLNLPFIWLQWYVIAPVIALVVHIMISPLLSYAYSVLFQKKQINEFVLAYIGTAEANPEKTMFRIYLLVIQIFASGFNVFLYCVLNVYDSIGLPWRILTPWIPAWNNWLQLVMNFQMAVNFLVAWTKNGFSWHSLLSLNSIIDILTVHGTFIRQIAYTKSDPPISKGWNADAELLFLNLSRPQMHWQFLRSYRCLTALMEIQRIGALSQFSLVTQQVLKSTLRLWALVNIFTGFIQVTEWIGHDLWMSSEIRGVKSIGDCQTHGDLRDGNLACVPFIVGVYWMFCTISSVGYGDYGPISAPTYLLVIGFIVAGVTFFSVETQTLLDVVEADAAGVNPAKLKGEGVHIVLTGGAVRDVDKSILKPFIDQLLHKSVIEQGGSWPLLVIVGKVDNPNKVTGFVAEDLTDDMARNIQFCNDDPLIPATAQRAKLDLARMVYILPSSITGNVDAEDEYNSSVALSLKSVSKTPFRLLLFRMRSTEIAISSGIHPGQCCSVNGLRSSMLAQSTRVRGWAHLLTLMTNKVATNTEGAKAFCHHALFPQAYFQSLGQNIRGFSLSKHAAGVQFYELVLHIYRETGALAFCMLDGDRLACFPWAAAAVPNGIVYCLHPTDFSKDPRAVPFLSRKGGVETYWLQMNQMRNKHAYNFIAPDATRKYLDAAVDTEVVTDQDMATMQDKVFMIKESRQQFVLVVMTETEEMWTMLNMYIQKFSICAASADGDRFGVIVLTDTNPPACLVKELKALDPEVPITFACGCWNSSSDLRAAGAEQCKVLLPFPVTSALSSKPTHDSRLLLFLEIVKNLELRKACLLLYELGSGMSGAHVLPSHKETPLPSSRIAAEIAFNPASASGNVLVPRVIMGLLASSFYAFGVLEVFETLTSDSPDPHHARPEQVCVPKALVNKSYGHAVEALLQKTIGAPCPALLLGLLRETLDGEVVLLSPHRNTLVQDLDLLFVLVDQKWTNWADEQGLRCMGGRHSRDIESIRMSKAKSSTRVSRQYIRPSVYRKWDEEKQAETAEEEEEEYEEEKEEDEEEEQEL